jgi:hypothetical protein
MNKKLGFILLRCVKSAKVSKYWKISYRSIRKFHPDCTILLIDDNSDYNLIDKEYEKTLINTKIINSELKGRGEHLPYYYYIQNKLFENAIIIHDSVFINCKINIKTCNAYIKLWDFGHEWDQPHDEINLIKSLNNHETILDFYKRKNLWRGCFGAMCIINYNFLYKLHMQYDFKNLLQNIKTRYNRKSFERVIGCILNFNSKNACLFKDIHNYCRYGTTFEDLDSVKMLPIIKIWCGR